MRHRVAGRRLGRDTDHRKMMRRTLITQLFRYEKIKTTEAKAKAIRAQAEKMITLARNRGDADRLIDLAESGDEETLKRLLTDAQARRLLREAEAGNTEALEREAYAIAVHAQRLVARDIRDRETLAKLFHDIAPRYLDRPGGYTRIVRLGRRKGDAAQMVMLMLVEED
ncbi:MAG TPA: 50S ribosomal protein L17 [Chloroflexi bacterium]|nr:50S ribosomal protein L17 [Chloroflexota bacterium]